MDESLNGEMKIQQRNGNLKQNQMESLELKNKLDEIMMTETNGGWGIFMNCKTIFIHYNIQFC